MVKKKSDLGRNISLDGVLCKIFHVGLKERFCERGGWIRVDNNCFQFFHPL